MKKLFLDDIRDPDMIYDSAHGENFVVVRSYDEILNYIRQNGLSDFISFDNDLDLDESGEIALMVMQRQSGWFSNRDWTCGIFNTRCIRQIPWQRTNQGIVE